MSRPYKPEAREVDLYPLGSMLGVPHSLQAPSAMAPEGAGPSRSFDLAVRSRGDENDV